jgi:uncharacterized membrane protein YphA (DoxX/SURF4 family)
VDTVLTIVQILLGLAFVAAGVSHFRAAGKATPPKGMEWIAAVPPTGLRAIGALEVLGGATLIVTTLTGPAWLSGLAAIGIVLVMVSAVVFHLRRSGEVTNAAFNSILGAVALIVAYANLA